MRNRAAFGKCSIWHLNFQKFLKKKFSKKIWKFPAICYGNSNFSKIRQDLPNLFFPCKSMKSGKFPFQFLATFKIALAAFNFGQNNTVKTRLPQKIFLGESIHINNFTNFTGKQLRWSLFSIKFQAFRPAFFLKTDSNAGIILWRLWNF